jgi:DNA invertase Pin-like site-specific DNA recombinase
MLGVFAEFEINLRRERQLEGIAKAKSSTRAARLR